MLGRFKPPLPFTIGCGAARWSVRTLKPLLDAAIFDVNPPLGAQRCERPAYKFGQASLAAVALIDVELATSYIRCSSREHHQRSAFARGRCVIGGALARSLAMAAMYGA